MRWTLDRMGGRPHADGLGEKLLTGYLFTQCTNAVKEACAVFFSGKIHNFVRCDIQPGERSDPEFSAHPWQDIGYEASSPIAIGSMLLNIASVGQEAPGDVFYLVINSMMEILGDDRLH